MPLHPLLVLTYPRTGLGLKTESQLPDMIVEISTTPLPVFKTTVTELNPEGDAYRNGLQVGDEIIYIDMFDISDLSGYFTRVCKNSSPAPPPFTFDSLIHKLLSGREGSVVRLGVVRDGSPIVIYKALTRNVCHDPVRWRMRIIRQERRMPRTGAEGVQDEGRGQCGWG